MSKETLIKHLRALKDDLEAAYERVEELNSGENDGDAWSFFSDAADAGIEGVSVKDAFDTITADLVQAEAAMGDGLEVVCRLLVQLGVDAKEMER